MYIYIYTYIHTLFTLHPTAAFLLAFKWFSYKIMYVILKKVVFSPGDVYKSKTKILRQRLTHDQMKQSKREAKKRPNPAPLHVVTASPVHLVTWSFIFLRDALLK